MIETSVKPLKQHVFIKI